MSLAFARLSSAVAQPVQYGQQVAGQTAHGAMPIQSSSKAAAWRQGASCARCFAPLRAAKQRSGSFAASASSTGSSSGSSTPVDPVGVVIVDHGSRKAESNDMLLEFAELFRHVTRRPLVEIAHMELAEPTIEQAVARCVARGAQRVVVAPYFLSRGRHVQQDIPALVAAAAAAHPGVECVLAEPIGIDPLMAQLIDSRVQAALAGRAFVAPDVAAAAEHAAAA